MNRTMWSEPVQSETPVSRQVNTGDDHNGLDQMSTPQYARSKTIASWREPILIGEGQMDGMSVVKELSQNIVVAMKASKRSSPEPAINDGNTINFQDWELDFDAYVESRGLRGMVPPRYLKKFTNCKVKDTFNGHFITNLKIAYHGAGKHSVNTALRKKLDDRPRVGGRDSSSLRSYADFLSHVKLAMRDNLELQSLNHSQRNKKLAVKLPDRMIRTWARKVKEKRSAETRYPTYEEFIYFVVDQAEVMDEPLMLGIGGNKEYTDPSRKSKKNPKVKGPLLQARCLPCRQRVLVNIAQKPTQQWSVFP